MYLQSLQGQNCMKFVVPLHAVLGLLYRACSHINFSGGAISIRSLIINMIGESKSGPVSSERIYLYLIYFNQLFYCSNYFDAFLLTIIILINLYIYN